MGEPNAAERLCSRLPDLDVADDRQDDISGPKVGLVSLMTFRAKLCSIFVDSVIIHFNSASLSNSFCPGREQLTARSDI